MRTGLTPILTFLFLLSICAACDTGSQSSVESKAPRDTATPTKEISETANPPLSGRQAEHKVYEGNGWRFRYSPVFDKVTDGYIQESSSGKTIAFAVEETTESELLDWIASEIERKLGAAEADVSLVEPLSESGRGNLKIFRYMIHSDTGDMAPADIPTVIFFDGKKRYVFWTHHPDVSADEFNQVIDSFEAE